MTLKELYDSAIELPLSAKRKAIDQIKLQLPQILSVKPESLREVKEQISLLETYRDSVVDTSIELSLDVIPQMLKKLSCDVVDQQAGKLLEESERLDEEVSAIIEAENLRRISVNTSNAENREAQLKPYKDFLKLKDDIIASGYMTLVRDAGFVFAEHEYIDYECSVEEATEMLRELPTVNAEGELDNNKLLNFAQRLVEEQSPALGIVMTLMLALALTPFFNIVALFGFVIMFYIVAKNIKLRQEVLEVVSLITNFSVQSQMNSIARAEELQPMTEEEMDNFPALAEYEQKYLDLEERRTNIPMNEFDELTEEFQVKKHDFEVDMNNSLTIFDTTKEEIISEIEAEIEKLKVVQQEMIDNFKKIGERRTKEVVYKQKLTFGLLDNEDQEVDLTNNHVVICDSIDKKTREAMIRLMIANLMSRLTIGKFTLMIYDPDNSGSGVMPFYHDKLADIFQFRNSDFNGLITDIQNLYEKTLKTTAGRSIDDYNSDCLVSGKEPFDYTFVLILSDSTQLAKKESMLKFMETSIHGGIYFWIVGSEGTFPAYEITQPYAGVRNPMNAELDWCNSLSSQYAEDVKNNAPAGIKWSDFIAATCPDAKFWKGCTDNEVLMYPGYINGDPTRPDAFGLGNTGNVHALGVGTTGAGKSVMLNHFIYTLCAMYSPAELHLWLCDFKGSEFIKYITPVGTDKMLPHIQACLCTSDGDYASTLFKALQGEGERRYALLQAPDKHLEDIPYMPEGEPMPPLQDGVKDWNKYWRNRAKATNNDAYLKNCLPRILMICDEFQNIFQKAEAETIEILKAACTYLAKVARAANINLFFTSQSVQGTLSKDVLNQFSLRFALRCEKDVASDINVPAAGNIRYKFGYMYVGATGLTPETQPMVKSPYTASYKNEDSPGDLVNLTNKCSEAMSWVAPYEPFSVITYNEATEHPIVEMERTFEENREILPDSGVIFLGNRMSYSANKLPENVILSTKNNTHIMSVFNDMRDYVLFFNQVVYSIQHNEVPGQIMINSQVDDLDFITCAEDVVAEKFKPFVTKKTSCAEVIKTATQFYQARVSKPSSECKPMYFILLGWDKGVGTDFDLRRMTTNLLQTCGEKNIHFIFINTSMTGINGAIINACTYRIAGHCSMDDSIACIGKKHASKTFDMKTGWIYVFRNGSLTKDKLYISKIEREIAADEIVVA